MVHPKVAEKDVGSRPMELMLMGLGGCTAFDVVEILRKGRQQIDNVEISLNARRADSVPAVFEEITIHFVIFGTAIDEGRVRRAIALTAEKYCSASIMLEKAGVAISPYIRNRGIELNSIGRRCHNLGQGTHSALQ